MLAPTSIAVVSEHVRDATLPPVVVFGGAAHGDVLLFLRFDDEWKRLGKLESAFLILEPAPGTAPDPEDVPLEAFAVRGPWTADGLRFRRRPELGPPRRPGLARSSPPMTLRIDVTEIAEYLSRGRDHGVAIRARSRSGHGAAFLTGLSGGPAPKLELYLTPASSR